MTPSPPQNSNLRKSLLWASPFLLVALAMGGYTLSIVWDHHRMRSWKDLPATILRVELKESAGLFRSTRRVDVEYEYTINGTKYRGSRLSICTIADNAFQDKQYRRLKEYCDKRAAYDCYVNPKRPTQSVLLRRLYWQLFLYNVPIALGSGCLGLLIFGRGALRVRRRTMASVATRPAYPDAIGPVIRPLAYLSLRWSLIGAILTNLFVWYFTLLSTLPAVREKRESWWTLLILPGLGLLCLVYAAYRSWMRWRFGRSVLRLRHAAGLVGGPLEAVVEISRKIGPLDGFQVELICIREGPKKDKRDILWQTFQIVRNDLCDADRPGSRIPILLAIPFECLPTDSVQHVRWELKIKAELPGLDFTAAFEVPVCKTAESRENFQLDKNAVSDAAGRNRTDSSPVEAVSPLAVLSDVRPGETVRHLSDRDRKERTAMVRAGRRKLSFLYRAVFPLALAGVGFLIGGFLFSTIGEEYRMRGWTQIPAMITHLEKTTHRNDNGKTYHGIDVTYTYSINGKKHYGTCLSHEVGQHNEQWVSSAYRELEKYHLSGEPFRCYVHPNHPTQSILYPEISGIALVPIWFGGIAFSVLGLTGCRFFCVGWLFPTLGKMFRRRRKLTEQELAFGFTRGDWARGEVLANKRSYKFALLLAVYFCCLTPFFLSSAIPRLSPGLIAGSVKFGWKFLVGFICGAATLITIRRFRYRRPVFILAEGMGRIGDQIAGVIRLDRKIEPIGGFRLKLVCREECLSARELWVAEQTVDTAWSGNDPTWKEIPVLFMIPADCQPTRATGQGIFWQLKVTAPLRRFRQYKAIFEVPVFRMVQNKQVFHFEEHYTD